MSPLLPLMRAFGIAHERLRGIKRPGLDNDKPHRGVISQEARTILPVCRHMLPPPWPGPRNVIKHDDVPGRHCDFPAT